ncbi:unnamed protein product [Spirodela intermedia]|uniref:Uncharacterized protein n=1 Tax=Spirodela intermedia TaxID=51605 RepID=A0A7I8JJS8_SPIIN|nr:unnamed protein product [Spirodela intermedia]CAA6670437.1 unnamed protein product [Spirodela intermedia]
MGRRIVSGGCHLAEQKNGDFASEKMTTLRLFDGCHLMERSWMEVGRVMELHSHNTKLGHDAKSSRVYDHSLPHSRLATGDWISSFSCRQISTIRMMSHTLHVYSSFSGLSLYPLIFQQLRKTSPQPRF